MILKTCLATAEADLHKEIKHQMGENNASKSSRFCINNLSENDSVSFYTGFPNLHTFQVMLLYLKLGENSENIPFWRSIETKVDENL